MLKLDKIQKNMFSEKTFRVVLCLAITSHLDNLLLVI